MSACNHVRCVRAVVPRGPEFRGVFVQGTSDLVCHVTLTGVSTFVTVSKALKLGRDQSAYANNEYSPNQRSSREVHSTTPMPKPSGSQVRPTPPLCSPRSILDLPQPRTARHLPANTPALAQQASQVPVCPSHAADSPKERKSRPFESTGLVLPRARQCRRGARIGS